jgi:hypothetical protein
LNSLALVLKLGAPIFLLVAALHLVMGPSADVLLGANLSAAAISDPVLDSQNRFYGVSFALYGVLLFLCSTDLAKYSAVLKCVLAVFFAAGLARLVSIGMHGVPSIWVIGLLATELVVPPILAFWLHKVLPKS